MSSVIKVWQLKHKGAGAAMVGINAIAEPGHRRQTTQRSQTRSRDLPERILSRRSVYSMLKQLWNYKTIPGL